VGFWGRFKSGPQPISRRVIQRRPRKGCKPVLESRELVPAESAQYLRTVSSNQRVSYARSHRKACGLEGLCHCHRISWSLYANTELQMLCVVPARHEPFHKREYTGSKPVLASNLPGVQLRKKSRKYRKIVKNREKSGEGGFGSKGKAKL